MAPRANASFDEVVRDGGRAVRAALEYHGYCVIKGVLPSADCAALVEKKKSFIESLGFGGRFSDRSSYGNPELWPPDCKAGIFGSFGAGACANANS